MKLSLFTPSNDFRYLGETYNSLLAQPGVDWEWVIVPNGPAQAQQLPDAIIKDDRVRLVPYDKIDCPPKIGALKKFACKQCQGDAFVELDHDDLLVPGVLTLVQKRLAAGAGFVYSDTAIFLADKGRWKSESFGAEWGWEDYPFQVYGQALLANRCFPVTARSLCQIFYAPDHIRCWSREAYEKAGGHDAEMLVADDHDLICRTYLTGLPFMHTGTAGYLYRRHDENSFMHYNPEVQQGQSANCDKYLYKLIDAWTKREQLGYLDLTCKGGRGYKLLETLQNTPSNSVGCVKAYDVLHFVEQIAVRQLFQEIYRVLAPDGWLCAYAPSTDGSGGFAPTTQSLWNRNTFRYVSEQQPWEEWDQPRCKFQLLRAVNEFPADNFRDYNLAYVRADLVAVKGQRLPGRIYFSDRQGV